MKKIISILLLIALCFSSVSGFAADEKGFPDFKAQKTIGRANWSAETHNGTICYDKEGNPLMCFTTQGSYFWVIDLLTGHVRERFNTIGTYIFAHLVQTAPDGKVYVHFYPANTFNVYDPIANTYTALDNSPIHNSQDGGVISEDSIAYLGEYNEEGARVFQVDIKTGENKYYGPLDTNCTYVKGITYDDKYIYAGTGTGPENAKMFRIDKETGEQTIFLENTGGGIIYTAYMINGKIIAHTNGKLHVVIPETLEKEITISTGHSRQGELYPSPYNEKEFYHFYSNAIWKYNTETQEHTKMADCELDTTLAWAELINGDWVLSLRSNTMEKIGYYNPKTNVVVENNLDQMADAGPNGQCMEISEEGILYEGGYQSSMGAYNINTGEFIFSFPKWYQNEGQGFLNGKAYFGTYTDAVMFRYDPERPLTPDCIAGYNHDTKYRGYDANPSMVYDIQDGQDRPFVVKGYKDKLYIGTMSGYNESGGALVILEEEDGINPPKAEVYRNIVEGQSITGIAVKDNLVYVSSTVRNGKGEFEFPDLIPQIIVFDTDKKQVVNTVTPVLPVLGTTARTIGEISFGPDGLLYGATERDGFVFALDPETFECVKYVSLNPGFVREALARPLYLRWGDDGFLYTTAGWNVYVINPATMEYKRLAINCSLMSLDHNGNLWYSKGAFVFNQFINQYDRLQGFLKMLDTYLNQEDYTPEEWTELQNAINEARKYDESSDWTEIQNSIRIIKGLRDKKPYIKPQNDIDIIFEGKKLEYDYDTTGTIKKYNGTTYVPYRAYLEMLGYKVTWDVHSSTIKAVKDGSEISMIVHKNNYTFNGEQVVSDICPLLLSGRQYIPVRLISEKLGYEVKWNEKENTVEINKK